jgi:hypothetical protein
LGTFAFVSLIAVYLWIRNQKIDRALALIFMTIVAIQLADFFLWLYLDNKEINEYISSLIPLILYLQPLAISSILWYFKAGYFVDIYKYIAIILLLYLPVFIFMLPSYLETPAITVRGPTGHLKWPTNLGIVNLLLYLLIMFFLFLTLKNQVISVSLLAGYAFSYYYYSTLYSVEWGSLWCHAANAIAVVSLFV